jgi:hypothetical protein
MKELIKENAIYKLFLIEMLDSFENNYKQSKDKELKKYFKYLSKTIEQVLNIDYKHINNETLNNLFKSEVE